MSLKSPTFLILHPLRMIESPKAICQAAFRPKSKVVFQICLLKPEKSRNSWFSCSKDFISRDFISRVSFCKSTNNLPEKAHEMKNLQIFKSWDWLTVFYVMLPYLLSIFLTGIMEPAGLTGNLQLYSQKINVIAESADELATKLLIDQILKTMVKLSVIYAFVRAYRPFSNDVFSYRWEKPFDLQCGWVVWGSLGLLIAMGTIFLMRAFLSGSSAGQVQNEADPLLLLLPFIGISNIRFPVPISVLLSAATFSLSHQSSGHFLEIFTFGVVMGLAYAQTRNLFAAITIHACWNVGVSLLLTFLQIQGHNVREYVL